MNAEDVMVGDTLRNKYGQTYRVIGKVKRGLVLVTGNDVHQHLKEWDDLAYMEKHHGLHRITPPASGV